MKMSIGAMIQTMSEGLGRTCAIFGLTLLFSLPLGLIFALLRKSRFAPVRMVMRVFISVLRGTPLMLQLLAVTYGPVYLFDMSISRNKLVPIIIGFALNYAAYFAEIYRGGIESMPVGQYEAAAVLGYSRFQTFFKIILPQVIKRILPSVTNEVITLVKDTSLAFTLSVAEMFSIAKALAASQTNMIPFVAAGLFYYIFNLVVAVGMEWVEKKMDYYR